LKPGQDSQSYRGSRFRLTSIMESLAKQSGDVEELVAVKSKNLSIAEIYQAAGQSDKALKWAESGLKKFADRPDSRLNEFLANLYHNKGRHKEAMELMWSDFKDYPGLTAYQKLKEHADRYGQWDSWRTKALKYIRGVIGKTKSESKRDSFYRFSVRRNDNSVLVEIFLWEQDFESAWKEAIEGGCNDRLRLKLAGLREKEHPTDATKVYQRLVGPIIERTNNDAYREAVGLIKKTRKLMKRTGDDKEFKQYIADIRTEFKRKRNFMAMLDRAGLK